MTPEAERAIDDWLIEAGLGSADPTALLEGFCVRLEAAGLPLLRGHIGSDAFHPVIAGLGFVWRRGAPAREEVYTRAAEPADLGAWRQSPFASMLETGAAELRRPLVGPDYRAEEFPLLESFRSEGGVDYLALGVGFGDGTTLGELAGVLTSWITDRKAGFCAAEVAVLRRLVPRLALAYKAMDTVRAGRTLVETYLGRHAGRRILKGAIARGEAETLRTVLWYSDLVGFTRIADTIERPALVALLNDYGEGLVNAIRARTGHVLKFMGDGILACFPAADDALACGEALDAAAQARTAIDRLNQTRAAAGQPVTDFRLALHLGDVAYGNIGAADRLDFTVVGPAVNEVARIEAMCRALDQPVLVSAAFAAAAGNHRQRLVSVGRYALRGVARPQELFTLDFSGPVGACL